MAMMREGSALRGEEVAGAGEADATDNADLGSVYRRHAPFVARVAMRLLGACADIDDVVQEVFIQAMGRLDTIREPAALRGWLATVTVRVVSHRLRRRRFKRWLGLESVPADADVETRGATADERALLARVYRVLDEMPVAWRNAYLLRFGEGERLEDVAEMTGCSLATVKRRLNAVQQRLDEVFNG